jgi:hypothetical protein
MKSAAVILGAVLLMGVEPAPLPAWVNGGPLPDGVTVVGTSSVTAPASQVVLTLNVTARDHYSSIGETELQPLIDALVQSGASRSDIALPAYLAGGVKLQSVPVTLTLHHPDAGTVARGAGVVAHFLLTTPTLWVATATVQSSVSDCDALVRSLQQNAVAQAHENAQRLATYAQARLDDVSAIDGTRASFSEPAACTHTLPIWYPNGILPLEQYLNVELRSEVRLRYTIGR